ncbi:MAG: type II secretion system protein [Lachnospiraceae bacterium]|nr:type II secretion system protein [Lachnospiraceae bacterium]
MRRFATRKLNNKGMSLVELLVTVAIIALIAAPLINSFLNAMETNSKARLIQNGTAVAQDTAELFKSFDLDTLVSTYEADGVTVSFDDATGIYTFEGIEAEGADGEDFIVDVKLDPTQYRVGEGTGKVEVNDVNLPVFSGLYGSDCIMLYRQYAGPDEQLEELFAGKLEPDTLSRINDIDVRKDIKKSTVVNIVCDYNSTTGKYLYKINVEITYTYDDVEPVYVVKTLEKSYDQNEIHNIYMLCPIFDRYSTADMATDYYYNTDSIKIYYTYNGAPEFKHDMYFYIAEQKMTNMLPGQTLQERINPRNVYINDKQYTEYNNESNSLKVYTNIGDRDTTFDNKYGLTYGDYNTGTALYELSVDVRLEGEDKVVTSFTTSK